MVALAKPSALVTWPLEQQSLTSNFKRTRDELSSYNKRDHLSGTSCRKTSWQGTNWRRALDTDPLHKPRVVQQCSTLSWCSLKRLTDRLEFPLKRNKRNTEEEESQNQSVLCISFVSEIEGSWRPRLKKSRNVWNRKWRIRCPGLFKKVTLLFLSSLSFILTANLKIDVEL